MRHILWLEWDGFYVGDETETPVVVLRDKAVLDINAAARQRGIRRGMPPPQVRTLAPDCRFEEWQRDRYEAARRKWLDICATTAASSSRLTSTSRRWI